MFNLTLLIDLALAAGARVRDIYQTDFDVALKPDASPVTRADTEAEAIILAGLARHFPEVPVVAEEATAAGRVPAASTRFFLVDPLDGTREFTSRNGEFTVNIALIDRGKPVAGVVFAPALGRLWWGGEGEGAFAATVEAPGSTPPVVGAPTPIQVREAPPFGLCAIGSRSHGSGQGDPRLSRFDIRSYRTAGSSLKFCLVAAGEADLYPRFGPTMEWDTAAGDAILRAAGGRVVDLDGLPLVYGKRERTGLVDFANSLFVALGDPRLVVKLRAQTDVSV